jgi:uncharacterized protein involved in exopolysaccharide biosynthesis
MAKQKERVSEEEINFLDIMVVFIKKKWWFIGTFLLVMVLGLVYVFLQPANHIVTYQIEMKENYTNPSLNEYYPNYENELNYLSIENIPVIFISEKVFNSIRDIDTNIDYQRFRNSDSFSIKLNEETSIFNISVSRSDYKLADSIATTLISSFENVVIKKEEGILDEIIDNINTDIEDLEEENNIILETKIAGLEQVIDSLYADLDRYIVDYNIELSDRLEKNKNSENVSFYNVIIPPNDISNEIAALQREINIYEDKLLENNNNIVDLAYLLDKLEKDENIITRRISLLSDSPIYNFKNDRLRNAGIVVVISIILGVAATFIVNGLNNPNIREKLRK